jgi:protein disulfide-isomerase
VIGVINYTKEVLLTQLQQVMLFELDYPRRTPALEVKKQNNELQQAFGIQGFQIYFANVDTEGKVILI